MNVLNLLVGLNSVILIFLVVNAFKPFIGSYAAKKGENLATKEDIEQLTKIAEGIKAEISDKVWDRQKQWELKRDAVIEVMRNASPLMGAMKEIETIFAFQYLNREEAKRALSDALARWADYEKLFLKSLLVAQVFAGEELIESLQKLRGIIRQEYEAYFAACVFENVTLLADLRTGSNLANALTEERNAALRAARKELDVKDADCVAV